MVDVSFIVVVAEMEQVKALLLKQLTAVLWGRYLTGTNSGTGRTTKGTVCFHVEVSVFFLKKIHLSNTCKGR
jgi:hypothetical protein